MNREQAKELLPIIQAFAEGKIIEVKTKVPNDNLWIETNTIGENPNLVFRIKPEEVKVEHTNCKDCGSKICGMKGQNRTGCINWRKEKYRPFKDCSELIRCYEAKYAIRRNACLTRPIIWVRDKTEDAKGDVELITGFTEHGNVLINGTSYPLQHLFQMYEFLDGSPVGVEE